MSYNPGRFETSAFGENKVVEPTQVAVATFAYGALPQIVTSGLSASASMVDTSGMCEINTGAAINSSGIVQTRRLLQYVPGEGGLIRATCRFDTPVNGSFQLIGYGDETDGFFFGYNGTEFGVLKRRAGVDEWVTQDSWNKDIASNMDWTKLNIFEIKFQWLGVGAIEFRIEDPDTGTLKTVHVWDYANRNLVPSILNPSLPLTAWVQNTTNNTNLALRVVCLTGFVEGKLANLGFTQAKSNEKTGITTETSVISIRNKANVLGAKNRGQVIMLIMSAAVDGNKPAVVRLTSLATLGGSPSWTSMGDYSIVEYEIAGTTVTGGVELLGFTLGKADSLVLQPGQSIRLVLQPGEWVTASVASAQATDASVTVTWREEY